MSEKKVMGECEIARDYGQVLSPHSNLRFWPFLYSTSLPTTDPSLPLFYTYPYTLLFNILLTIITIYIYIYIYISFIFIAFELGLWKNIQLLGEHGDSKMPPLASP